MSDARLATFYCKAQRKGRIYREWPMNMVRARKLEFLATTNLTRRMVICVVAGIH